MSDGSNKHFLEQWNKVHQKAKLSLVESNWDKN